jgi:hypothetical protein
MHRNVKEQLNDAMCLMEDHGTQKDERKVVMLLKRPPNRETWQQSTLRNMPGDRKRVFKNCKG